MSDQHQGQHLEERLQLAARSFSYPLTPDISGAVRERLAREVSATAPTDHRPEGSDHRPPTTDPRLAWVGLAVLVALLLSLGVPEVQAFVRSILRIGSIEIVVATPTPGSTPGLRTITPNPAEVTLTHVPTTLPMSISGLMGETSLADVQTELGHAILTPGYPSNLGPPDKVYAQYWAGTIVILVWLEPRSQDRARLILYQVGSDAFGEKAAGETTLIQETTVNGRRAAWVTGPHVLRFLDSRGQIDMQARRFVEGNVLVWEQDGISYRLESALTLEEAVRVAESLR